MEREKIYCFDFDGTLTCKDTLLEFIRYAKGTRRFLLGFLLHSPLLVLMKLHLYPNWKAKQRIFGYFFQGMGIEDFDALCAAFARDNMHLLRPKAVEYLKERKAEGDRMFVVSASIDNWVRPFFVQLGMNEIEVIGTQIEVKDGLLTGRFTTPNCYGLEKVRRLQQALNHPREKCQIFAFGDSRGDKELLAFADQGYFKPFREE